MTEWVKKVAKVDKDKWFSLDLLAAQKTKETGEKVHMYELLDEALEQYLAG